MYCLTAGLKSQKALSWYPWKQWQCSPWFQKQDRIVIRSTAETGGWSPYFRTFSQCRWWNAMHCGKMSHLCTLVGCWQNICVFSETQSHNWTHAWWEGFRICVFPQTQYCQYFFSFCIFLHLSASFSSFISQKTINMFHIFHAIADFLSAGNLIPLLKDICW